MPRIARELSPLEVRLLVRPGRWSVGGVDSLALQLTGGSARSWVLCVQVGGPAAREGPGQLPEHDPGRGTREGTGLSPSDRQWCRPRRKAPGSHQRRGGGAQHAEDLCQDGRGLHRAAREVLEERQACGAVDGHAEGLRQPRSGRPGMPTCWDSGPAIQRRRLLCSQTSQPRPETTAGTDLPLEASVPLFGSCSQQPCLLSHFSYRAFPPRQRRPAGDVVHQLETVFFILERDAVSLAQR